MLKLRNVSLNKLSGTMQRQSQSISIRILLVWDKRQEKVDQDGWFAAEFVILLKCDISASLCTTLHTSAEICFIPDTCWMLTPLDTGTILAEFVVWWNMSFTSFLHDSTRLCTILQNCASFLGRIVCSFFCARASHGIHVVKKKMSTAESDSIG